MNINVLLLGIGYKGIAFSRCSRHSEWPPCSRTVNSSAKPGSLYLTALGIGFGVRVKENTRIPNLNGVSLTACLALFR
ncbi:MAG: hypothetical protein WAN46_00035 [Gammaproteobacteria bacterium]